MGGKYLSSLPACGQVMSTQEPLESHFPWIKPLVLATWEVEIRIVVPNQSRQKV
jgi:hypothetical protein